MDNLNLRHCPFCGSRSEIIKGVNWFESAYQVQCVCCGAKGIISSTQKKGSNPYFPDYFATDIQAIQKAVDHWNNRIT